MKSIFLIIILGSMFLGVHAQQKISGVVNDVKNKVIIGASVALKNSYEGVTTDSVGHFNFTTSEKGFQKLIISAIGYKTIEREIVIGESSTALKIELKEEFNEMKAVVITAGSFEASDRKRSAIVLNTMDVITTAGANGDVTAALKTLPGSQQIGEVEGLFVRGGTGSETKIFIDGSLVNRFYFSSAPGIAGSGRFNPFLFKGTIFSTGGYSALFGQALSSAIILESVDMVTKSSAVVNVSDVGLQSGFQWVNKKKTVTGGINYNFTSLAVVYGLQKTQQHYFLNPTFHNLEGNFRIKLGKTGIIKYNGILSTSKLGFHQASIDSNGFFDLFQLKNLYIYHNFSWKQSISKNWKLTAGTSYTNSIDDILVGLLDENKQEYIIAGLEHKKFAVKSTGEYFNAKIVVEKKKDGLNAIRFGGEYNASNEHTVFTDHNSIKYKSQTKDNISSLFAEGDIYLTTRLAAKIGTRLEYSSYLDKYNISPRISLACKINKFSQASFAYGIFYQNPESKYLPTTNSLRFSRADHYVAQYQMIKSLRIFRTEVFYKKYYYLLKTGYVNGREGVAINNNGFGDAKGFEIFWRDKKSIKNLDYWISYSFLETKRDFLNFPYAITPNFAAKHTVNIVVKEFVMRWKTGINVSYNFASGRPYYNISFGGNQYTFTDKGVIPAYHNVSLSLNYVPRISMQNAKSFAVYALGVNNVLNLNQQYGYRYSQDGMKKEAIKPPSKMFIYIGAFFSFGIDRTEEAINNNL